MADVNGTNVKKFSNQLQYNGEGPLDSKQIPVSDPSQLPGLLKSYEGQTITVITDDKGEMTDYQFMNGKWIKKHQIIDCGEF